MILRSALDYLTLTGWCEGCLQYVDLFRVHSCRGKLRNSPQRKEEEMPYDWERKPREGFCDNPGWEAVIPPGLMREAAEKLRQAQHATCTGIPQCGIPAKDWRPGMCHLDGCPREAAHRTSLAHTPDADIG